MSLYPLSSGLGVTASTIPGNVPWSVWSSSPVGSGVASGPPGLPQADDLLAKAELAAKIIAEIQRRRLTQSQAGVMLGIDQPKISALRQGKLAGFSIERLVRFLLLLGRDVEITVKDNWFYTVMILQPDLVTPALFAASASASRTMCALTNFQRATVPREACPPSRFLITTESDIEARTNSVNEYTSEPAPGLRSGISEIAYAS